MQLSSSSMPHMTASTSHQSRAKLTALSNAEAERPVGIRRPHSSAEIEVCPDWMQGSLRWSVSGVRTERTLCDARLVLAAMLVKIRDRGG